MVSSLNDLVPCFFGRNPSNEGGQEDPAEFLENITFATDSQIYTNEPESRPQLELYSERVYGTRRLFGIKI